MHNPFALVKTFFSLILLLGICLIPMKALGEELKQVVIINPLRGNDFWKHEFSLLDTPKREYEAIKNNNLPATWLIRYDAIKDGQVIDFIKSLDQKQEVGLLFEITPSFTTDASVAYNQSDNWHFAKSAFLVGYSQTDRIKLIDTFFKKYKDIFNRYPKSVGAWWIDSFSLSYMHDKYGVAANLDVSDQYSTDQYQVWGQYWSVPFYPSKLNALMTAQSVDNKIGLVTIQWATRDPYNGYGKSVYDSTFSVQVNDYFLHKLDYKYFEKLIDIYPQITVGLENDFAWSIYGSGYVDQIKLLSKKASESKLQLKTMSDYSAYYKSKYPGLSPDVVIQAEDPLGTGNKVVWYQTPIYRVGWFYNSFGSSIRDLRVYDSGSEEKCYRMACSSLNLASSFVNAVDDVIYQNKVVIDIGKITNLKVSNVGETVNVTYINQSGSKRTINFLPRDIEINGKIHTLSSLIIESLNPGSNQQLFNPKNNPDINFLEVWKWQVINFGKFIIGSMLFFLLPGLVLTRNLRYSIPVGWVIFTLTTFILGYMQWNFLIWVLPIVSLLIIVKARKSISYQFLKRSIRMSIKTLLAGGVIVLGSVSWLITVAKSGFIYNYGIGFWGPNGHDAIWHLSLISSLQRHFPPQNPVFSGETLSNYHYFFDLLIANFGQLMYLDSSDLLLRFFPIAITLFSGIAIYTFTIKLFNNFRISIFSLVFFYFGGSFGWVVSFIKDSTFSGESTFWAQQSISSLLNPPFAISVVFLFVGLSLMIDYLYTSKRNIYILVSLVLLFGTLIGFKVYAGILILAGLGFLALYDLVKNKSSKILIVFLLSLSLSLAVFLPNNSNSTSLIEFSPLWLVNSMIDFPDRLGWEKLSMARQAYFSGGNLPKLLAVEVVGIFLFVIGNFGTRILLFLSPRAFLKLKSEVAILLFVVMILGLMIPLIFVQKGNNWNIVQFFYYTLLMVGMFSALALDTVYRRLGRYLGGVLIIVVIIFTLPTSLWALTQYLPDRPPARLTFAELEALNFLKQQPEGVVMTQPYNKEDKTNFTEPVPLFAYTSNAYVSAYSNHDVFLEDEINLEILGIDYKGRLNEQINLLKLPNLSRDILVKNKINYLYLLKWNKLSFDEGKIGVKKIFENDEALIYKVIE